jgi:HD-like signal output (HDOD) protein
MRLPTFFKRPGAKGELAHELDGIEVPSFPAAVARLLTLLRGEDASTDEIAQVLQHDPGLHVRVLRTVNSAAYGLSSKVENVQRAVTLLGRSRLEALVLAVAVKDAVPRSGSLGFDTDRFWLTAARRATLARVLARRLQSQTAAEAFTAGLLQDVAVPVLAVVKGKHYREVYERWRREPLVELSDLERDAFGRDHQEVGAIIATRWELPEYLIQAIGGHHDDGAAGVEPAVKLVSRIRDDSEQDGVEPLVEASRSFGLEEEEVRNLVTTSFAQADEFSRGMS